MSETTGDLVPASGCPRAAASPLFWLNLLVAVSLLGLLLVSPLVLNAASPRIVRLFALDSTVRKTGLAGAIGLVVTGFVFFRSRIADPTPPSHRTPPSNVVGA